MREYQATILENKPAAENIYSLTLALPEAVKIRAGQFADLSVGGAHLLKRPLAVCKADGEKVTVCYQIRGEGTKLLSERKAGETLDALLPLGNGFYLKENEKKIALVGGGVGIFPMISVIGEYAAEKEISAYIGFRNKGAVCGLEELKRAKKLTAVTDDGSFGEKMNAVQAFAADLEAGERPDVVLSCGPLPMLRALKTVLEGRDIPCYVSLEERMGCGIGACLVCVCEKTNGEHARVCKDGPVFGIGEVVL
ncbi:MAG: dihydroorotate dehydrogenase electron transfer subunit [Christensenellaceae bacterium]|jgi:oxidoreductase FAD/NAD(P)-binding domain protein|nr:dihydroorotate dehydrogenase electron transfer subunit [Clostridia bacterium]PWM02469.1 MAG: hypothetical protein DBY05_02270 [Clostridiales bacterium]